MHQYDMFLLVMEIWSGPPLASLADSYLTRIERVMGIGPTSQAWEARILPLYYTRKNPLKNFVTILRSPDP